MVFLAGVLRGFSGYGFALAAVPLLSLISPPAEVVPFALLLQLFVGVSGLGEAVQICDWRSVRLLTIGAVVATPLGIWALTAFPENLVRLLIAVVVGLGVVVLASGLKLPAHNSRTSVLSFGAVAGLFNGLAGIPGPPVIAFYLASPLGSACSRASMIVLFLFTSAAAMVPLFLVGALSWGSLALSVAGIPIVFVGSWAGTLLHRKSSEAVYRWAGIIALSATALMTAVKAASGLF